MSWFIDRVQTYEKYRKMQKGTELYEAVKKIEFTLISDPAAKSLEGTVRLLVNRLNDRFPRTKKWIVSRYGRGNSFGIYVQPSGNSNGTDEGVCFIGCKTVRSEIGENDMSYMLLMKKGGEE